MWHLLLMQEAGIMCQKFKNWLEDDLGHGFGQELEDWEEKEEP